MADGRIIVNGWAVVLINPDGDQDVMAVFDDEDAADIYADGMTTSLNSTKSDGYQVVVNATCIVKSNKQTEQ